VPLVVNDFAIAPLLPDAVQSGIPPFRKKARNLEWATSLIERDDVEYVTDGGNTEFQFVANESTNASELVFSITRA
jgi:hypothetical protein